jgi:hypothetical protein
MSEKWVIRLTALGLWLVLALIAAVCIRYGRTEEKLPQDIMVRADYQTCVGINPGPLMKPKGVVLYPRRKDIA